MQVWETTVLLWISKLPWLKQRVPPNFEQATRESLAAYFKTKPWARRAHPSIVAQGEEAEEVRRLRHARWVRVRVRVRVRLGALALALTLTQAPAPAWG